MARTKAQLRAEQAKLAAQQAQARAQQPIAQSKTTTRQNVPAQFTPAVLPQTTEKIDTGLIKQFPRFTPQQQMLQQQFLNQLSPLLQQLSKPVDISNIISQRTRDFETQTIPSLMERLGTGPTAQAQRSSALGGTLGAAGSGLQQDLAALQTQAQMSDMGRLQKLFGGLSSLGFEQPYERGFFPSRPGFGEQFGSSFASGFGGGLGGLAGALPRLLAGLFF